jgi:HlyD family secretion protein
LEDNSWEILAETMRLLAIIAEKEEITFPGELLAESGDPAVAEILKGQESLFLSQIASREGNKDQLNQRTLQLEEEIRGLEAQLDNKREQSEIIQGEYDDLLGLYKKKLVPATRVLALEREVVSLKGRDRASHLRGRPRQGPHRRDQHADHSDRRDHPRRIPLAAARTANQDLAAARTARGHPGAAGANAPPRSALGLRPSVAVHTVGGVIGQGETLMLIVPDNDDLVIEARLRPQDLTQVH